VSLYGTHDTTVAQQQRSGKPERHDAVVGAAAAQLRDRPAGVMQRANLVSEGRGPPPLWRHSLGLATHR
jgi:hypothetical protein